jgi:hypothetical protein
MGPQDFNNEHPLEAILWRGRGGSVEEIVVSSLVSTKVFPSGLFLCEADL